MNRLPKSYAVFNDGSQLFKDTVIKYFNKMDKNNNNWTGESVGKYYCCDKNLYQVEELINFQKKGLTLIKFIELSKEIEKWTPKYGEKVLAWDDEGDIKPEMIYMSTIPESDYPYVLVDPENFKISSFAYVGYKNIAKIESPVKYKLEEYKNALKQLQVIKNDCFVKSEYENIVKQYELQNNLK